MNMLLVLLILLLTLSVEGGFGSYYRGNATCVRKFLKHNHKLLEIYWINLDKSTARKNYMNQIFSFLGFQINHRISAITPEHIYFPKGLERSADCKSLTKNETLAEIEKIKELQQRHELDRTVLVAGHCGEVENEAEGYKPLACTISHLIAIHQALYQEQTYSLRQPYDQHHPVATGHTHRRVLTVESKNNLSSAINQDNIFVASKNSTFLKKYALILEDDLRLAFEINFEDLIATAPKDFVILQLVTNNKVTVKRGWDHFLNTTEKWILRNDEEFWSTGAYIIHKERLKTAVDTIIQKVSDNLYVVRIQSVKGCSQMKECCENNQNNESLPSLPCVMIPKGHSYAADHFVYNMVLDHTYVTTVPLVMTSTVATISTIHTDHVKSIHLPAFSLMKNLMDSMLVNETELMPSYLNPACAKECHPMSAICLRRQKNVLL